MIRRIYDEEMENAQPINDNNAVGETQLSLWYYLKSCLWYKFFCFKGRARRKEYLVFQGADFLIAGLFYGLLSLSFFPESYVRYTYMVISTVLLIPLFSVTVRRLHDIGLSAWWCVLGVVPYAGIVLLSAIDSQNKINKYGEIPEGKVFKDNGAFLKLLNNGNSKGSNVIAFKPEKTAAKKRRSAA